MKIIDQGFEGLIAAQQTSQKSPSSSGAHGVFEKGHVPWKKLLQP
jgi:hypothetical protein